MILTKQFLINQYIVLGKSGYRIAKELNIPKHTVDNAITKFSIIRRSLLVARLPKGSTGKTGFKWCPSCKKDKEVKYFSKGNNRFGLDAICKSCNSNRVRRYFPKRMKERRIIKTKLILEFGNKCSDCGAFDLPISAFVFHHHSEKMNNKEYISPSKVITTKNANLILKEKNKWILVCANCHSVRHSIYKLSATKLKL